jgi:CRISPR-associated endoribonuclease Cas6
MSSSRPRSLSPTAWATEIALVGIELELAPLKSDTLYPEYAIGLHAWFLNQVQQSDPALSAYLHDGQSEKPFTLSRLTGLPFTPTSLTLNTNQTYRWSITALSPVLVQWLAQWLPSLPDRLDLRGAPLRILRWTIIHPPTTYAALLQRGTSTFALSFLSPTSFRHRQHHLPLPVPRNVFQSYLRRWNDFSGEAVDSEDFLDWIDEYVVIVRHQVQSIKVTAGKRGSVTGFTGSVEFSLLAQAHTDTEYTELFKALGQLAPYCGTGHKTTFGLGQTCLGWQTEASYTPPAIENLLAHRIAELTELFRMTKKRQGGDRAISSAETWATILARRELGESLQTIAIDLGIPYETAKTYAKLARKALLNVQSDS